MPEILALDPGERVGWARATVAKDGTWTNLRHGITPLREMALSLYHRVGDECEYDVVVCEKWTLYPHTAQQFIGSRFPSVQFIGMVQLCCWMNCTTKLVMQGASVKKLALKSMSKLRPDLYELVTRPAAHDDAHDCDALIHLWAYTFKNYV